MKYIIMCGGKYKNKDATIIKQFFEVNNEQILSRTIRLLQENNISKDDIIITGDPSIFSNLGLQVILDPNNVFVQENGNIIEGYWVNAFYHLNAPCVYLFGDVYYSEDCIKKIVSSTTDDILFFSTVKPFNEDYIKDHVEPLAFKVVDYNHFYNAIESCKNIYDAGKFWRSPIAFDLWCVIRGFPTEYDYLQKQTADVFGENFVPIYDYSTDVDNIIEANQLTMLLNPSKVCINAICKNEIKMLTEWVNNLDKADYFAILDTGSTDGTWEELQKLKLQYPDKFIIKQQVIEPFYFNIARNEAIKLVPKEADWVFVVDFDERVSSGWHSQINILDKQVNIYKVYRKNVINSTDTREIPISRIFRNNNQTCWFNPVHETLGNKINKVTDSNYPVANIYLDHYDDGSLPKLAWYNTILEQYVAEQKEIEWFSYGARAYLAYQNYLLGNYKEAWKKLQQLREFFDNTPAEIIKKHDWNDWWIKENWNIYRAKAENKIAVYTICKNELQFVDKWISSMQEADYICVLDTGSTDGTYEKLLEYQDKDPKKFFIGRKIITPWRFDIARNESLKLVPEDTNIFISTDLDEILHAGWAEILRENWIEGKYQRAVYKYIWSHTDSGEPGRIFGYDKIHTKDWEWRYPVHELLWHKTKHIEDYSKDETLELFDKITLEHFPDKTKSRGSYLELLELRERDYPEDMYGLIYLAHEYNYKGFFEKSIEKLNKVLTVYDKQLATTERASCYLFMGDDYVELGKYPDAITSYLKSIEVDQTYREPYLNLAKVFIEQKQYKMAIDIIKDGLAKSYRHYSWLERDTSWSSEPYDLLCLAYYYNGQKLESLGCAFKAAQIEPENERLKNNIKLVIDNMTDTDY